LLGMNGTNNQNNNSKTKDTVDNSDPPIEEDVNTFSRKEDYYSTNGNKAHIN